MNLPELHRKLIAAARANPPGDGVPYAFEKRIMARLRERPLDSWALWAGALLRATVPCLAIMLLLSAWSVFVPGDKTTSSDLSQEMENTVLAAADQEQGSDSIW
jgi:hypothetical protein